MSELLRVLEKSICVILCTSYAWKSWHCPFTIYRIPQDIFISPPRRVYFTCLVFLFICLLFIRLL